MKYPKQTIQKITLSYQRNPWLLALRVIVIVAFILTLAIKRIFWTPDVLFLGLMIVSAVFGQTRSFLIRFFPLVSLLLLYELFRGFADDLSGAVNIMPMIDFDRWMFSGHLPTVALQGWWWSGDVSWYDFYFYALYMIHFLMPILLAVLIWKQAKPHYWQFMWALVGLSFAAFVTYLLYPAAPPWMAYRDGYIPEELVRVSTDVWWAMGIEDFSDIYSNRLPANEVAAVPSLHSAYPLLFSLFITGLFGLRRFWWVYMYPISLWIGVVYLGEHYVIDVILGALYAALAYMASVGVFNWYYAPNRRARLAVTSLMTRLRLDIP